LFSLSSINILAVAATTTVAKVALHTIVLATKEEMAALEDT
jgi:hypothetical protein